MIELIPETYVAPLDLVAIFGRVAPLRVDLGCGDGSFLRELAQRYPDQNFLGMERLFAISCRKHRSKHFICCSPIPGPNGATVAGESLERIFSMQFIARLRMTAFSESLPINWIILKRFVVLPGIIPASRLSMQIPVRLGPTFR